MAGTFPKDWTKYDTVEFFVRCQESGCVWVPPYINNSGKAMHEATTHWQHTFHKVKVSGLYVKDIG